MKASITNTSKANQGIWTDEGLEFLAGGETREITIRKDYVERAKALPFLTFADPLDHDGNGKKGGAKRPAQADPAAE